MASASILAPVAFFNLPQQSSSSVSSEKTIMEMSMEEEAEDYSTMTMTSSSSDSSSSYVVSNRDPPPTVSSITTGTVPDFAIRKSPNPLCPCCNLSLHVTKHQVVGETPKKAPSRQDTVSMLRESSRSLLTEISAVEDEEDDDELDEDLERMMPGVLGEGVAYTVREVIAQGYVRKKGSGYDWLGSRAWKARWAVLVRARVDGHDVGVPLLQIFWTSTSPTASTVISLDSAVVIPENNLDPDNGNPFRFKIRHVKKSVSDPAYQLTRIFSCPKESRDDWVYAINHALLEYEKEKANARRLSGLLTLSPPRRRISPPWMTDEVVTSSPNALRQQRNSLPRPVQAMS